MNAAIDFYFDFSSPYSYIASEWVEALAARHGRTVNWKAILLGVTFQAAELKSPVEHPIKREYSLHDFERSARFEGVPLKIPEKFPIPTQNAARLFWWLNDKNHATASHFARHCLRAMFARGVDLSDGAQLVDGRDARALEHNGVIPGAIHAPRGMLEFWVDPESPYHREEFAHDKEYVLFCAAGWRSALATRVLMDMGMARLSHIGGGF